MGVRKEGSKEERKGMEGNEGEWIWLRREDIKGRRMAGRKRK